MFSARKGARGCRRAFVCVTLGFEGVLRGPRLGSKVFDANVVQSNKTHGHNIPEGLCEAFLAVGVWPSPAQCSAQSGPVRPSPAQCPAQSGPVRPSVRPSVRPGPAQSGPVRPSVRSIGAAQSGPVGPSRAQWAAHLGPVGPTRAQSGPVRATGRPSRAQSGPVWAQSGPVGGGSVSGALAVAGETLQTFFCFRYFFHFSKSF